MANEGMSTGQLVAIVFVALLVAAARLLKAITEKL